MGDGRGREGGTQKRRRRRRIKNPKDPFIVSPHGGEGRWQIDSHTTTRRFKEKGRRRIENGEDTRFEERSIPTYHHRRLRRRRGERVFDCCLFHLKTLDTPLQPQSANNRTEEKKKL